MCAQYLGKARPGRDEEMGAAATGHRDVRDGSVDGTPSLYPLVEGHDDSEPSSPAYLELGESALA